MRGVLLRLFLALYRLFRGKGLSRLSSMAMWWYKVLQPSGVWRVKCLDIVVESERGYSNDVLRGLILNDYHQKFEMDLFRRVIRAGDVVVDVGTNIGSYALVASRLVGEKGKVFAFEPVPSTYRLLMQNIHLNGFTNIQAEPCAVTNWNGHTLLYVDDELPTEAALFNGNHRKPIEVKTLMLDSISSGGRLDILKMDAEGAEGLVLAGASRLLQANPQMKIFTEFSVQMMMAVDYDPLEFLSDLTKAGFRLFYINETRRRLEPYEVRQIYDLARNAGVHLYCERPQ